MAQVTCTVAVYVYISGSWTVLNDAQPIHFTWGMGNAPLDRLADVGTLDLILDNSTGLYTPGGASMLAGWKCGLPVKVVYTYDGETFVRFRGHIADIEVKQGNRDKKCYVTVLDWLDYALRRSTENLDAVIDRQSGDAFRSVVNDLIIQPQTLQADDGRETFDIALSSIGTKTKAYNEFAKIALSELGYVYVKKDATNGELLVFESANSRNGWNPVGEVPLSSTASGFGLHENGDFKLHENGDFWLLSQTAAMDFNDSIVENFDAPYGDHLINQMTVDVTPIERDASPQVLFRLNKEIKIAAGATKTIRGRYSDPDGGKPIQATDMIDPVITTDYTMFTATGGGGSNISTDLSITMDYKGGRFKATFTNNNGARGYINLFTLRGTGIYEDNPTQYIAEDVDSIDEFDTAAATLNQAYKQDLDSGTIFADSVVADFSQPKIVLDTITFTANKSDTRMMAFLTSDIGTLRHIVITELAIDSNYYIQGVDVTTIGGGLTRVTWTVQERASLLKGYSSVAMDFAADSLINFGVQKNLLNQVKTSYSAWVYFDTSTTGTIISLFDRGVYGLVLYMDNPPTINVLGVDSQMFTTQGTWITTADAFTTTGWYHVAMTFDITAGATADPILYVNGVSKALTESSTPAGTRTEGEGTYLLIGNDALPNQPVFYGVYEDKIFDPRIYNRILTAAEVTTLYNSGTPLETLVTDGLVFQGLCVPTGRLTDFVNVTLDDTMFVRDNIYGAVGRVAGAPIGRAHP